MKTITFYSYKGGTGRTLALANAARYLSGLGYKVVALDFDLEAPGLHYKFFLANATDLHAISAGVVDYIYEWSINGVRPNSINDYIITLPNKSLSDGTISIMPAGPVHMGAYWQKLSSLDWHQLFYSDEGVGMQIFMDLKNRIIEELNPDFILIDSRTGITEMGGIATTILADHVVCLVLPTLENLEGARAVLRSLRRTTRLSNRTEVEVTIALSRLPREIPGGQSEAEITERIKKFMNEPAKEAEDSLCCLSIYALHSDSELEQNEALRIGSGKSPEDFPLIRDYLRLFSSVVPVELIEAKVESLIEGARSRIWDDPDGAIKQVEELSESFTYPETYRALLKFYVVRSVVAEKVLRKAQSLWEITKNGADDVLWQVLRNCINLIPKRREDRAWRPDSKFLEEVWMNAGKRDRTFALVLAEFIASNGNVSQAAVILRSVLLEDEANGEFVQRIVNYLLRIKKDDEAKELINIYKPKLIGDLAFLSTWANVSLRGEWDDFAKGLLEPGTMQLLRRNAPSLVPRLLLKAGKERDLMDELALYENEEYTSEVVRSASPQELFDMGIMYKKAGRIKQFEMGARKAHYYHSPGYIDQVLDRIARTH